ncbi:hypothetical protein AYI70_g2061 [Smittium culicis]|uniref:Uncharacterized protein n=1 Tax=Smittium culicis TaxID=133412 RepID=A0A1R1YA62_9FUNG|nr:hypothetical protein AYI70_g2061 [Smittium culicis]
MGGDGALSRVDAPPVAVVEAPQTNGQPRALDFKAPTNTDLSFPTAESFRGRVGFTDGRLEYGCRTGFGGGHKR